MLELVKTDKDGLGLDRTKWHFPLLSIVITHHNYSDHIRNALLSLLDQTYTNWECVIVDDDSDDGHRLALECILEELRCNKIRAVWLEENIGQIPAFFVGLVHTRGEFVCPLDPDDRYAPTFLEESLEAHLHPGLFCPVVCTDQFLLKGESVIAATTGKRGSLAAKEPLSFTHANTPGWHWTSTSALMLRRTALNYIRPHKPIITPRGLEKKALDAYIAQGAHRLGGTIFINKPLVYRSVHENNSYISDKLCTSFQSNARPDAVCCAKELLGYLKECLEINQAPAIKGAQKTKRQLWGKWRRSLLKRWRKRI